MLSWLYDMFVAVVTFVMGLFGFDLKKRSVTFADDVKDAPKGSVTPPPATSISVAAETTPVTEPT